MRVFAECVEHMNPALIMSRRVAVCCITWKAARAICDVSKAYKFLTDTVSSTFM